MFYTIYKITNLRNNKIYIGQHITDDLNDAYMGSGKNIDRAKAKYGIKNFKKEILFVFDNEDDMNEKEKELVTEEFCVRDDTYNIVPGGFGNWTHINKNWNDIHKNRKHTVQILKERNDGSYEAYCNAISNGIKGKSKSEEHRKNISKSRKQVFKIDHQKSVKNASNLFKKVIGTVWVTDGINNKRIKEEDLSQFPDWQIGRSNMKNKGTLWVHHPETKDRKMVNNEKYLELQKIGYIKGVGARSSRTNKK